MKITDLNILQEDKYWDKRDSNYGIMISVHTNKDGDIIDFNTNIDIGGTKFIDNLFEYLQDSSRTRLIIISRTRKEVGNDFDIPDIGTIEEIKTRCQKDSISYYNFLQNPFPDPIYNFKLDDSNFVLRFGYDNGGEIDKLAVNKKLCINKKDNKERNYYIMVTKDNNYILDER